MITLNNLTMSCKVGITTSPVHCTLEWRLKYPEFSNWKILGCELPYVDARNLVEFYAHQLDCEVFGLDDKEVNPVATWYIYYFEC